jgi:predicted Zn finger-like uncharacterized protein
MLIVCPNCATSYRVETGSLGEAGCEVRCVRCRSVWVAADGFELPDMAQIQCAELEAVSQSSCEPGLYASGSPEMPPFRAPAEAMPEPLADNAVTFTPERPQPLPQVEAADEPADLSRLPAAHRRARQRARSPLPSLPVAFVVLIFLHGALIGWRAEVVKVAPQTAPLYAAIGLPVNLHGLTFANVTTVTQLQDGVPVLVVEGAITSASSHPVEVPRLRLSIRNSKGQEIYAWTQSPERSVLAPGEMLAFRSRLASPPPDTGEVVVRFLSRNDLF